MIDNNGHTPVGRIPITSALTSPVPLFSRPPSFFVSHIIGKITLWWWRLECLVATGHLFAPVPGHIVAPPKTAAQENACVCHSGEPGAIRSYRRS